MIWLAGRCDITSATTSSVAKTPCEVAAWSVACVEAIAVENNRHTVANVIFKLRIVSILCGIHRELLVRYFLKNLNTLVSNSHLQLWV